jgi:serine protease
VCSAMTSTTVSPIFRSNDVYATKGATIGGICAAAADQNGNIAADPLFNTAGKGAKGYALTAGSPAIDVGATTAMPGDRDLLSHQRRVDGNGDGVRAIDLGAIEYRAH